MDTKTLSREALAIIDSYKHFTCGDAVISIPYFNNRRSGVRAGLRGLIGKGTIEDIKDELTLFAFREKMDIKKMPAPLLKKYLVEHSLGIDCSGFAFYILNAESKTLGKGSLRSRLKHPFGSLLRKCISWSRPAESTGVQKLAHNVNSHLIPLAEVKPGDFISMIHADSKYDHIIVIHQVEYTNGVPVLIHYTHSMAWPSDGQYDHGIKQGEIRITDLNRPITEQEWIEALKTGNENYTLERAVKATKTELRRLNWF